MFFFNQLEGGKTDEVKNNLKKKWCEQKIGKFVNWKKVNRNKNVNQKKSILKKSTEKSLLGKRETGKK